MKEEIYGFLCSEERFMGNPGMSQSERGALSHLGAQEPKEPLSEADSFSSIDVTDRIIEHFRLERTLQITYFQTPAMDMDIFH